MNLSGLSEQLLTWLNETTILGIPLGSVWLWLLVATFVIDSVIRIVLAFLHRHLKHKAELTDHPYDDYGVKLLDLTWKLTPLAIAVLFSIQLFHLDTGEEGERNIGGTLRSLALVLLFLQVGRWGRGFIDVALERGFKFARFGETASKTAYGVTRFFAMAALWAVVTMLVLSILGIPVTPLLASVGVGGIAIGFALQQILGDIFCSVAIVLDRPFEVGDFIINGEHMGTVESIGIKTTRVRSLGGEQIVFPNSDLIGSRVRNYKRMEERRVLFQFGVLYSTTASKLEEIPEVVKSIIGGEKQTRFDRAHFASFGDSSLNFEVVYYVLTANYNEFMDIQQRINLALVRRFETMQVGFAFPTRTVQLEGTSRALRAQVLLTDGSTPKYAGSVRSQTQQSSEG